MKIVTRETHACQRLDDQIHAEQLSQANDQGLATAGAGLPKPQTGNSQPLPALPGSAGTTMDKLLAKIEGPTTQKGLEPETVTLLKMAMEAQKTGKMPPLPISMQPLPARLPKVVTFLDCIGTNNGVGKITAPQRIG